MGGNPPEWLLATSSQESPAVRILFFSNPLPERLTPLLPLARALRESGHTVAFATAVEAAPWLEPDSFELVPFGPTTHEVTAEVARRIGVDILFSPATDVMAEYFAGARVDLMADEAVDRAGPWAPDLIVSEHCDLVGPLVASAHNVPCAVAVTGPAPEPEELDALTATVRSRYLDRGLQPPARTPSGRWLLHLSPPSLRHEEGPSSSPRHMAMRAEPCLGPVPQPRARRVSGTGRPKVLVGFGAEVVTSLELGPVLKALSALDVDLLVAAKGRRVDVLEGEREGIRLVPGTAVAETLEDVTAVLHHGGPDITFAAAARGVPAVVVPESPAQLRWTERLAAAGAAIVLPAGERDPATIAAGLGALLSDARFTAAASRLREEAAAMPTAVQVAEWLVTAVTAADG
ncbi:glycosyltransferase [Streptomyces adustus]